MSVKKIVLLVILFLLLVGIVAAALYAVDVFRDISGKDLSEDVYILEVQSGDSAAVIAARLKANGVIRHSKIFTLMAQMEEIDTKLQVGTYELRIGDSYSAIFEALSQAPNYRPSVRLTFYEGMEVSDIVALFLENGIGTEAGFQKVLKESNFGFSFLPSVDTEHRLEGYLYPDTYDFFLDDTEENVLGKMVKRFYSKMTEAGISEKAEALGLSLNEAVILGSIIQKEGRNLEDFALVSSVFHNRLEINMLLQSDATTNYVIPKEERSWTLTAEQMAMDTPYNTYKYKGLTPTPICCPGIDAILAAVEPEKSEYFYFIGTSSGAVVFAKTYGEHLKNIEQYLK